MDHKLDQNEIEMKANKVLMQMSLEEKLGQMSGDLKFFPHILKLWLRYNKFSYPAGENRRLGIPGIRFSDGPRGIVLENATTFPVSAARGATWDPLLEERIGEAMGIEARALGVDLVAAVCINLLRHPAWGRAQETYGEDPYHLGEMGAALVRGLQRHVMACVKHFACNSIEDTRMKVDVQISERTLREIYLPHFKRCVDEGVACVMSAYNQVNGTYCSENPHLLREILKGEWNFQGFVISDFVFGLHDAKAGLQAGLDLEMPFQQRYNRTFKKLVENGQASAELIDEAVLRILRQKLRFSRGEQTGRYSPDVLACESHRALAYQAAIESIVLLKNEPPDDQRYFPEQKRDLASIFSFSRQQPKQYNIKISDAQRMGVFVDKDMAEPVLPINPYKIRRLAVIGRLATQPNLGDRGSSKTHPPQVVTPMQGIQAVADDRFEVVYNEGLATAEAADLARRSDAAVLFVGFTDKDEGENMFTHGGDRQSLHLAENEMALILTVASSNPSTVVVLMGSGVVVIENWREYIPAILLAWYPGMEGGHAIADIIFGKVSPSGKLPVVFPKSENHLPPFDRHATNIEYGYYHGYRMLERRGQPPAFPFGYGLSYTKFGYDDLRIENPDLSPQGVLQASVLVSNTGLWPGDEVVQFYVGYPGTALERPLKELKGFARIHLKPGEHRAVQIEIPIKDLAYFDEALNVWAVEPGVYALFAGSSSASDDLIQQNFKVGNSP